MGFSSWVSSAENKLRKPVMCIGRGQHPRKQSATEDLAQLSPGQLVILQDRTDALLQGHLRSFLSNSGYLLLPQLLGNRAKWRQHLPLGTTDE